MDLTEFLKRKLTYSQKLKLRDFIYFSTIFFHRNNLNKLAKIYNTDKWGKHFYTVHFMTHFKKFRYKKINLLEIGAGGYKNPKIGGESLRMWKRYFLFGMIYSIDLYDKSTLEEKRIKIFKGDQTDELFLKESVERIGDIDIIIDDGSHINEHVVETFKILFPLLKSGGIYVVEDTQTSYWPSKGGDSNDLDNPDTTMNFFKKLTDGLNYKEYMRPGYQPSFYDKNIVSIHFYHNLIFVYKGPNEEESNLLKNNVTIYNDDEG
jgi:hypothetical protein